LFIPIIKSNSQTHRGGKMKIYFLLSQVVHILATVL